MILVNWLRRASEEPHSSTAPGPLVEALFLLWSVSMSEKSDRAVSRANRPSSQLRSFCLVIYFTDGFNHGLRLVKLDVFRTIAGEDLFSVGRSSEPPRLSQRGLLLI